MTQTITILYTGINAKKNGKHTKAEFLAIMKRTYVDSSHYFRIWGSSHDPKKLRKFTLMQWVKWSGAIILKQD